MRTHLLVPVIPRGVPPGDLLPNLLNNVTGRADATAIPSLVVVKEAIKAHGTYFQTVDGRRFLDFNSQLMCVNGDSALEIGDRAVAT